MHIMLMKFKTRVFLAFMATLTVLIMGFVSCGQGSATLSIEESNNRLVLSSVHVAAVGLGEILKDVKDENQRIETIRNFIDPIRFFEDKSGYFYVYDYNCVNVAHAVDKTLLGKDLTDFQDTKGRFAVRELSALAKNGGGFLPFYYTHPQTKEDQRKIGYVEPIPGTDYFIGTGYYPDAR